ncbi:fused MFS/spermidine synthase [Patescibacteria group bacterium]|nr:fused MFS/spermidine synthase [Patescibacteria group bacterium]
MKLITRPKLVSFIYYLTVFLTGAAVLIFEVAAVRMLAPYFGSSLYVLSSVLTTILAALSLGYYFGGRIADRFPTTTVLYGIIGLAGLVMLFLQILALNILPYANVVFSITAGPLVLSLALFFVPAFLLGIDSPFVIKLLTQSNTPDHNGALVGSIFFFSTIGSIVGSIAAGFFLIPFLGLTLTISLVSILLIVWSMIALVLLSIIPPPESRTKLPLPLPLIIALGVGCTVYFGYITYTTAERTTDPKTMYQADGFYSHLKVFERTIDGVTLRFLKNDVNHSSAIIPGSQTPVFTYTQLADIFTVNNPDANTYLVLGGGSYTIPRFIHHTYPDMNIAVSEIEPGLFNLAHEYFELPITDKITNHEQDARVFLQSTSTQYDVIFSDVMNSGLFIPPHLATVEFFESFKARLAPDGIAILNFIGSLDTATMGLTGSMIKTISTVFPNYELLALRGPDYTKTQNMLFILRHDDQPIVIPNTKITDYFNKTEKMAPSLIVDQKSLTLDKQTVFTDNRSNIEPLIVKEFTEF